MTPAGAEHLERPLGRSELVVLALAMASLFVTLLSDLGVIAITGAAPLNLFRYYGIAAATGWLFGNLYVGRTRGRTFARRTRAAIWSLTPVPPLFLLRSMASELAQQAAPLAPLFACGVMLVLFLVPVSLRASRVAPRTVQLNRSQGAISVDDTTGDSTEPARPSQVGSGERA